MDHFLIDYLRSGRAWVLVGSGPSSEMGYPSWGKLAEKAISTVKTDRPGNSVSSLDAAHRRKDFPEVFAEAMTILGAPRLLQALRDDFKSSGTGEIYKSIARWPVPVYLTTNYDHEIQAHLTEVGETYGLYNNSQDHMANLLPNLDGAIFNLHGDLRSESGLVLTKSQYDAVLKDPAWEYWRVKMTAVFQMTPVVVVGHSLADRNIRDVLDAAKKGAGVHQPICWIAPDVRDDQIREYLEKFRIRVISYDNRDGDHANLRRLIAQITDFVPPRTAIRLSQQLVSAPQETNAAAAAFFVFNHLAVRSDYEEKRIEILVAAVQAAVPKLQKLETFTLQTALELAGWPREVAIAAELESSIAARAVSQGLLVGRNERYALGVQQAEAEENLRAFEHARERFLASLRWRIRRDFTRIDESHAENLARDIEGALTGYFKEGGLTLASIIFTRDPTAQGRPLPTSVLRFINEACARYADALDRQAFFSASIEAFTHGGSAEREYLGRIAQGFFGFHALGAFGDIAVERLKQAKRTIWLLDSNIQISVLALGATVSGVWRECLKRLTSFGIRLFTTERLFDETRDHWWFANRVVEQHGSVSPGVMASARGEPPFRRSNLFLEGFVRWQAAGNPPDWQSYNFQAFRSRIPTTADLRNALRESGVEVVPFPEWPGFEKEDFVSRDEYTDSIAQFQRGKDRAVESFRDEDWRDPSKKAQPEAEALIITTRERSGKYTMLSNFGTASPAWFVSYTSILNILERGLRITWQPEAFLKFASTISFGGDSEDASRAFDALLWGLAQSGISLLDDKIAETVFGGVIDQATISIRDMRQMYENTLAEKYGEPLESVLARVAPLDRPMAAVQLANELLLKEEARRKEAEARAAEQAKRAETAEKKLREVAKFQRKMEEKQARGKRKNKKQKAKSRKKGK